MLWMNEVPLDDKAERATYFASKPKTFRSKNPTKLRSEKPRFHEGDTTSAEFPSIPLPSLLRPESPVATRFSQ